MKKALLIIVPVIVLLAIIGLLTFSRNQNKPKINLKPAVVVSKIKLGYLTKGTIRLLVAVADKKGFFDKNNVKVEIQGIDTAIATTLLSKQVDAVIDLPSTFLLARANGADIIEVGEVTNDYPFLLISNPKDASGIRSIGVPRIGGEPYLKALEILKILNINPSSINFQATGSGPSSAVLLKNGKVDAVMESSLDWAVLSEEKFFTDEPKIIFNTTSDKNLRNPNVLVVSKDSLKNNPKGIENFSKALIEANNWIRSAKDEELAKIMSDFGKMEEVRIRAISKVYKESLQGLKFEPDVKTIEAIAKSLAELKDKNFDADSFVSMEIFKSLKNSKFIK